MALLADREFVIENFAPQVVIDMRNLGVELGAGQLYGFKVPPAMGGAYSTDNLEPTDMRIHFSILGQIHRQLEDVPAGTRIDRVIVE